MTWNDVREAARKWILDEIDGGVLYLDTALNECAFALSPTAEAEADYWHFAAAELLRLFSEEIIEVAPGGGTARRRLESDPFDARGCRETMTREAVK